jgi:hypothetical protein
MRRHGEAFRARLGDARRLNVGSTSDALARLRILENCISSVDLVLRRKVVGVGGRPVAPQGDPHVVISHGYLSSQWMHRHSEIGRDLNAMSISHHNPVRIGWYCQRGTIAGHAKA